MVGRRSETSPSPPEVVGVLRPPGIPLLPGLFAAGPFSRTDRRFSLRDAFLSLEQMGVGEFRRFADDDDAGFGDGPAPTAVFFFVIADAGAFRDADTLIDDRPADLGVASHFHALKEDRVLDVGPAIDADAVGKDGTFDPPAGDDGTGTDETIEGMAHAIVALGEDEFWGWEVGLVGANFPILVVEIEFGGDAGEVHVRFVESVDGADIAPEVDMAFGVLEGEGADEVFANDRGDDVLAEVVGTFGNRRVAAEFLEEEIRVEHIDAHVGQAVVGRTRHGVGGFGLFEEMRHPMRIVGFHDAKLVRFAERHGNAGDGGLGAGGDVFLDHRLIVHFIDVIAAEDEEDIGARAFEGVDVLVDGVGGASIPVFVESLLGRENIDVFVQFAAKKAPGEVDVAVEAGGLVLREDENPPEAAVEAIRESEVDNAVSAAKGNGGLGAIASERFEARTLASGQDQRDDALDGKRHGNLSLAR